jgi:hypothetical protein
MKKNILILLFPLLATACNQGAETTETELSPKTPVEIVHIENGSISNSLSLLASTVYLKRNVITAQIPAFITKVNIRLGDKIKKGDVLYELETKERRAFGGQSSSLDTSLANFGIIKVYASASGIISTLDKQQPGDYVLEGTQMCTIAESGDLAFQINVPFEFSQYVKVGGRCTITLPDNTTRIATITTPLSSMNALSQTQTILAKTSDDIFLPENLILKVQVNKSPDGGKQVLPKACVLSDEMMKDFWVMKLINDTTAVKIPVVTGNKNNSDIEIIQPQFSAGDRIIITGNYGLDDSASVKIINK